MNYTVIKAWYDYLANRYPEVKQIEVDDYQLYDDEEEIQYVKQLRKETHKKS